MLEQIARHGGFSLALDCEGDLHVDDHHTIEDTAICLGEALRSEGVRSPVSYENMTGGGGGRAMAHFIETADRQQDTLLINSTPLIIRSLQGLFPHDHQDLVPIAGLVGEYLIEDLARIPVEVEYASEFRYRNPMIGPDDVVLAISQSGETADTLAAMELARDQGALLWAIVNAFGSQAMRMADGFIAVRRARKLLDDGYDPEADEAFFAGFDWQQFSDDEFALCPPLFAVGGDGAMMDIGFQNLSRLMASGKPIKVLVLDTQVYSNTGGQACTSGFFGQVSDMAQYGKAIKGKLTGDLPATGELSPDALAAALGRARGTH